MNSAVILAPNGTDIMTIDLVFGDELEGTIKKNMARERSEPAVKTLERIRMLMADKPARGKKANRDDILKSCPKIAVFDCAGVELDVNKPNESFWCDAALIALGKFKLPVQYNVPTVTSITPPPVMMVGFPALCSGISTMFCGASIELLYEWGVVDKKGKETTLSREQVFFPTKDLLGTSLFFRCRPNADGALWTAVDTPKVTMPPAGFEKPMPRWVHTQTPLAAPQLRVVSYNILHDAFCTSNFAKKKLYPFASEAVLDLNNRRARISQELRSYNADIICLQECGRDVFDRFYSSVLRSMGYNASFLCKTGNVREGLVIAARSERFHFVTAQDIPLQQRALDAPEHEQLAKEIEAHPHFADAMERVTSVGFVVVVEDKHTGQKVIVANTHLFYHPNGCHIRALQAYLLARKVDSVRRQFGGHLPVVMCGDFNFTRTTGGYRLMTTGAVEPDNTCWEKGYKFWWGVDKGLGIDVEAAAAADAEVESPPPNSDQPATPAASGASGSPQGRPGIEVVPPAEVYAPHLSLPESMRFIDTHADDPTIKWTNYSLTFKEIIDHIFVSPDVKVLRTVPLPTEAEVSADVAIPSAMFPSDHVAIVADIELPRV